MVTFSMVSMFWNMYHMMAFLIADCTCTYSDCKVLSGYHAHTGRYLRGL